MMPNVTTNVGALSWILVEYLSPSFSEYVSCTTSQALYWQDNSTSQNGIPYMSSVQDARMKLWYESDTRDVKPAESKRNQ